MSNKMQTTKKKMTFYPYAPGSRYTKAFPKGKDEDGFNVCGFLMIPIPEVLRDFLLQRQMTVRAPKCLREFKADYVMVWEC
jgi:hypothetical protein